MDILHGPKAAKVAFQGPNSGEFEANIAELHFEPALAVGLKVCGLQHQPLASVLHFGGGGGWWNVEVVIVPTAPWT